MSPWRRESARLCRGIVGLVLGGLLWGAPLEAGGPDAFTVVTFNVGTTERLPHDDPPDDGYTSEQAAISDEHYGDGLAWPPAIEAARRFFSQVRPDLVGLQEILGADRCAAVPEELRAGFVCEAWAPGDPAVAQKVLGPGYQIACHRGKPDKCLAVRRAFGTIRGCDGDLCLDHLDGFPDAVCGRGGRVGRGIVDLAAGGTLTVVHLHATSGMKPRDEACRVAQVEQVFVDLGDGAPGASGETNVVLGDLNTDPGLLRESSPSARRWGDFVGDGKRFRFISQIGPDAPRGYRDRVDIDHVIADAFAGRCWIAGVQGRPPVLDEALYFDHRPVVCTLEER